MTELGTGKGKPKSRFGGIVSWFKKETGNSDTTENLDSSESATDISSFVKQTGKFYPQKQQARR